MRRIPPAGLALPARTVWASLSGWIDREKEAERLEKELESLFPGSTVKITSSGRAALARLLSACREARPGRDEVAIGSYTCWSVAAAAVRAGLKIRLIDVDPETLDFDGDSLDRCEWARVTALVTHHLFGLPNDTKRLERLAAREGFSLIDDAAQAFGASRDGRVAGSAGDAGLLSFGRGKGLPALGGGAIVFHDRSGLPEASHGPAGENRARGGSSFIRAVAHALFIRPALYPIPSALPFLHIGETAYDDRFSDRPMDGYSASLARRLIAGDAKRREARRRAAACYDELFAGDGPCRRPADGTPGEPAYIRYPLLVPAGRRESLLEATSHLGVSRLYPATIDGAAGLPRESLCSGGPWPGGTEIAERLVTLPTHALVRPGERETIARRIEEVCR